MKQSPNSLEAGKNLILRIRAAISKDKKFYLCGVEPDDILDVRRYINSNEIVYEVKPAVILLEGDTPDAQYIREKATGSFCRQISDPRWQSPSLREVKKAADDLGCLVAGIDIRESKRRKLIKKYDIRPGRMTRLYDRMLSKSGDLHSDSRKIPGPEYEKLRSLSSSLEDALGKLAACGNPVINSYHNLELMKHIIDPNEQIIAKYFSKRILQEFNDFVKDIGKYSKQADAEMFENIMKHYDGKQRVLCFVNYRHMAKGAHLQQYLRRKNVHFMSFVNYADFAKQSETAASFSLVPPAQKIDGSN